MEVGITPKYTVRIVVANERRVVLFERSDGSSDEWIMLVYR
jgi:hypothetical protein